MTEAPGWYPVALAAGLEPGTAFGTRLFGRELVVWRDTAGQSHVWEDRCPHRGMRLSLSFVRGDRIVCLYHGWQFDGAGRCRHIPAHPDLRVPGTIRAGVETAAEGMGMVWIRMGDAGSAPGEAETVPVRSLALRAPAASVFAGLAAAPPLLDAATLRVERSGPLVHLHAGAHAVVAAVQPVSDTESAVHLAIIGDAAAYRGAGQAAVSRWAEALRRAVE